MSADHKRPLFAFVLVMLACVLIIANGLRSEALVGMLRAQAHRVVAGVELVPAPPGQVRAPHQQPTEPPVLDVPEVPASTAPTAGDRRSGGSAPQAQHPSAHHPSAQHPSAHHPSAQHPATGHAAPAHPQAGHQHGHPQQGHVTQGQGQHGRVEHGPVGQAETATRELAHQVGQQASMQVGQLPGQRGHGAQGRGHRAEAHGRQGRGHGHGHLSALLAVHLPGQALGPRWARRR